MGAGPEGAGRGEVVRDDGEEAVVVGHVDSKSAEEKIDQRLELRKVGMYEQRMVGGGGYLFIAALKVMQLQQTAGW